MRVARPASGVGVAAGGVGVGGQVAGTVGAAVGWLLMQVIRFSHHDPLLEVGLTTVVAYAAFILANHYCKFSGVMAACGAGLVVNYPEKCIWA